MTAVTAVMFPAVVLLALLLWLPDHRFFLHRSVGSWSLSVSPRAGHTHSDTHPSTCRLPCPHIHDPLCPHPEFLFLVCFSILSPLLFSSPALSYLLYPFSTATLATHLPSCSGNGSRSNGKIGRRRSRSSSSSSNNRCMEAEIREQGAACPSSYSSLPYLGSN